MIRVYFDWNIFSYLRKDKEHEPYKTICSLIKNNDSRLIFPYSFAHLQDLLRHFEKPGSFKGETYKDLEFLQEISKGHCLYGTEDKGVNPAVISTIEYFNDLNSKGGLKDFNIENPFPESEFPEISSLWKDHFSKLAILPSGLNLTEIDKLPQRYDIFKNVFENTREDGSFYSLLKDVCKLLMKPNEQSTLYKTLRNNTVLDLKIDTTLENWGNNPIDYLNKHLPKTSMKKTFDDVIEDSFKISNKKNPTRYDYFTTNYITLDSFGYYRDSNFDNLLYDSIHAYFGAYCDYFITEDTKTYYKAKAVYGKLGIMTKVCKAQEFIEDYYSNNQLKPQNSILEEIRYLLKHSLILQNSLDDELNPVTIHKVHFPFIDYFNRMQITMANDATTITYYKKRENYSNFMFWTEIETVVNKIVQSMGMDDNRKYKFGDNDIENMKNDKWEGRIWEINSMQFVIKYAESPFGLCFIITFFEDKVKGGN